MFLTNLRTSFESGTPEVTYGIDEPDPGSLMDDRLDFKETLDEPISALTLVSDATTLSTALDGAIHGYTRLRDTDPAMLPSAVLATNNQLKDTADLLGVKPCYPVKIDPNTLELDNVSMEDYKEWLMKAGTSLISTLKDGVNRGSVVISKFNTAAKSIDSRVANCYGLIKKRKGSGGNPISIPTSALTNLVIGNSISTNLITDLSAVGSVINTVALDNLELIGKTNDALKELLGADINDVESFDKIIKSKVDNQKALATLKGIADQDTLYIGNLRFKLEDEAKLIPSGTFVESKPDAKLIAKSYGKIESLSTDHIRNLLGDLQKEVEKHVVVTNKSFTSIYSTLKELRVNAKGERTESNFDQVAATVKYVKQSTSEFKSMWGDIAQMHTTYYKVAGSILTYVEESLLKD